LTTTQLDYQRLGRRGSQRGIDVPFLKFLVFINALVPGAILAFDAYRHDLGADPVNYSLHTTGTLCLILLCLTLLVTPLRRFTGIAQLFHVRRTLGVYAFVYGASHFLIYFLTEGRSSVGYTLQQILSIKYLFVGALALALMVPLAATSLNSMIRFLGAKRWKRLHWAVYLIAPLGALHYILLVKKDERLPTAFSIVIGGLLLMRFVAWLDRPSAPVSTTARSASKPNGRWNGMLRVDRIVQETPDVRTFRLSSVDGSPLPFFHQAGQHLTLKLKIGGRTIYRNYTIASSPSLREACELTIKRDERGLASRFLHDDLREGQLLEITAAGGSFTFPAAPDTQAIALIAGGVGITPLMSILRHLIETNWPGQIHLLNANKTETDIIFRKELDAFAAGHPNLHIIHTLTRGAGETWQGRTGRIDAELLRSIPDLAEIPVYLCGPAEMIAGTQQLLRTLNVPEKNIHTESFGTPAAATGSLSETVYQVEFARSGIQVAGSSNRPLLEVAEENAIPWDSECRSGICGTCKCRLLSGSVLMPTQEALSEEERAAGVILLCQARPLEDVSIDA